LSSWAARPAIWLSVASQSASTEVPAFNR
jgi:hypothetical protein